MASSSWGLRPESAIPPTSSIAGVSSSQSVRKWAVKSRHAKIRKWAYKSRTLRGHVLPGRTTRGGASLETPSPM